MCPPPTHTARKTWHKTAHLFFSNQILHLCVRERQVNRHNIPCMSGHYKCTSSQLKNKTPTFTSSKGEPNWHRKVKNYCKLLTTEMFKSLQRSLLRPLAWQWFPRKRTMHQKRSTAKRRHIFVLFTALFTMFSTPRVRLWPRSFTWGSQRQPFSQCNLNCSVWYSIPLQIHHPL